MNSLGLTLIAAPVGQARTQAAPPLISLHISHLTAVFFCSSDLFSKFQILFSPGPGPKPNNNQENKLSAGRGLQK